MLNHTVTLQHHYKHTAHLSFMSQVQFMAIARLNGTFQHSPVPKQIEIWHNLNTVPHINRFSNC